MMTKITKITWTSPWWNLPENTDAVIERNKKLADWIADGSTDGRLLWPAGAVVGARFWRDQAAAEAFKNWFTDFSTKYSLPLVSIEIKDYTSPLEEAAPVVVN